MPDLQVYAILQRVPVPTSAAPGEHCAFDFPHAKHYRTEQEFFTDSTIELIVVCTTVETHFEFGKAALEAGKHGTCAATHANSALLIATTVVIEKPFTSTSAQADELIRIARKSNKILPGFQSKRVPMRLAILLLDANANICIRSTI